MYMNLNVEIHLNVQRRSHDATYMYMYVHKLLQFPSIALSQSDARISVAYNSCQ